MFTAFLWGSEGWEIGASEGIRTLDINLGKHDQLHDFQPLSWAGATKVQRRCWTTPAHRGRSPFSVWQTALGWNLFTLSALSSCSQNSRVIHLDSRCPTNAATIPGIMSNDIKIRIRVRMEPDLEESAGHLLPHQRRALARKFYRWSKQLWLSAEIIEKDEGPKPPPKRLPFVPRNKVRKN